MRTAGTTPPRSTTSAPGPWGPGRRRGGLFSEPGWPRALLGSLIGAALGFGLVVGLRAISGLEIFQTESTGYPHVIVPALTAPFGWLIGFGAFDYWFRWAAGKPTIPDDHSDHGADGWRDYFKFNTDHKVIGI